MLDRIIELAKVLQIAGFGHGHGHVRNGWGLDGKTGSNRFVTVFSLMGPSAHWNGDSGCGCGGLCFLAK
ncbi:unnamed protein product [Calypogeia fissa]